MRLTTWKEYVKKSCLLSYQLKYCDQILNSLDSKYRERDDCDEKVNEKIDETEILRTFIEQLKKVIENFPNYGRHLTSTVRGNTEYFMYDVVEIHSILEEALRPVFRIDKWFSSGKINVFYIC